MQSAFSVRTLSLFDRLPLIERPSYLSGLVIGEELRTRALRGGEEVVVGAETTWNGLFAIASAIAATIASRIAA